MGQTPILSDSMEFDYSMAGRRGIGAELYRVLCEYLGMTTRERTGDEKDVRVELSKTAQKIQMRYVLI